MVVDTSVIVHIYLKESGWQQTLNLLEQQERRLCSVASIIEAQAVIAGRTEEVDPFTLLDSIVLELNIEVAPLTLRQSKLARAAYLKYGKGQGHKAQLNYGDVMSYALAKDTAERLAFVGDDFQHTDLKVLQLPL